jgi:hypothetical protein
MISFGKTTNHHILTLGLITKIQKDLRGLKDYKDLKDLKGFTNLKYPKMLKEEVSKILEKRYLIYKID